jgi:dsDNA-specific endonuclease/ATPase MutS2
MPQRDRTLSAGDPVQTPLGKGAVREMRGGRVVVEIKGRSVVLAASDVTPLDARRPKRQAATAPQPAPETPPNRASGVVDLHGLTVEEARVRAEQALNDALLADLSELRFIHGRSSDRIRAALHGWLRRMPAVRKFRIDPLNAGVTVVSL